MTQIYKALITDLDGTAIPISSEGSDIDDRTRQAVRLATQRGYHITCATGREWELTKPVAERLGLTAPCIIEGGTRIIDPTTEKTLWEKFLDDDTAQRVFSIFKTHAPDCRLMTSKDVAQRPIKTVGSIPDGLRFLYAVGVPLSTAELLLNHINGHMQAAVRYTPSWKGEGLVDVHATHPEGTKEYSIKFWQQLVGVTKAETIGLGDSGNDIPIFQSTGFKIAVENATDPLKQLADHIAPSASNDALAYAINTFLLQKP
jgi:hydroxymethylpyrimidine pyrophosphatase-like HAD family hydrolase